MAFLGYPILRHMLKLNPVMDWHQMLAMKMDPLLGCAAPVDKWGAIVAGITSKFPVGIKHGLQVRAVSDCNWLIVCSKYGFV